MLILLILIIIGYFASRFGVISREGEQHISKFVVNIASPLLIISSVTSAGRLSDDRLLLITFAAAVLYYVGMPFVARLLNLIFRVPERQKDQYELLMVFSNIGFMGIPVIKAIFGNEAILYVSVFMAIYNVSIYSYGYLRLQNGNGGSGVSWKKIINPGTVAALIAIVLYLLDLHLPEIILEPVTMIGDTTTPLAMIIIGATLTKYRFREVVDDVRVWIYTALKLLIVPAAIFFAIRTFISDALLVGTITVIAGMPVGSMLTMMCSELNHDSEIIEKTTVLSTVLSVVTIPVLTLLL